MVGRPVGELGRQEKRWPRREEEEEGKVHAASAEGWRLMLEALRLSEAHGPRAVSAARALPRGSGRSSSTRSSVPALQVCVLCVHGAAVIRDPQLCRISHARLVSRPCVWSAIAEHCAPFGRLLRISRLRFLRGGRNARTSSDLFSRFHLQTNQSAEMRE